MPLAHNPSTYEVLTRLRNGEVVSEALPMSDATVRHLEMLTAEGLLERTTITANDVPFRAWYRAIGAVL